MRVCLSVHVGAYVRVCVCLVLFARLYACECVSACVSLHVRVSVCMCACVRVCVCVCETLLPRDSFMCNTCRGTQHVTGTVSNEAASGMGRED